MRSLRVVLSNGASIFVPTSLRTDQPHFLAFDIHNHNLWRHRIKTDAESDSQQPAAPDHTRQFYARYAGARQQGQQAKTAPQAQQAKGPAAKLQQGRSGQQGQGGQRKGGKAGGGQKE